MINDEIPSFTTSEPKVTDTEKYTYNYVSNLPIFGHFCHPIFAHKNTKKAAEAAVLWYLTSKMSSNFRGLIPHWREYYFRPHEDWQHSCHKRNGLYYMFFVILFHIVGPVCGFKLWCYNGAARDEGGLGIVLVLNIAFSVSISSGFDELRHFIKQFFIVNCFFCKIVNDEAVFLH